MSPGNACRISPATSLLYLVPQPRILTHGILRWLLVGVGLLALLIWGGGVWAAGRARQTLNERLARRNLQLTCRSESWSPWHGVTLTEAALTRLSGNHEPVASISTVHIAMEWKAAWEARAAITRWQASDATLVVNDAEGAVTLEHVTTDFTVRDGNVQVARLAARSGPAVFDLTGDISTASGGAPGGGEFSLRLKPLRSVLSVFTFPPESKEFTITGRFNVDARQRPWNWTADLRGTGQEVLWRGVPLKQITSEGKLSQDGMTVANQISFPQGSAKVDLKREGWKSETPIQLSGTVKDSDSRGDEFAGEYQTPERRLKIARLEGRADLFELARNVPALAEKLPRTLKLKSFPDIAARDFVYSWQDSAWSVESVALRSPADFSVSVREHMLEVADVTGTLAYAERVWRLQKMRGKLLGGSFAMSGSYDGHALTKADIDIQDLHLSRLSPWVGKVSGRLENSAMTLVYKGAICGREPVRSTGSGSLVLSNAPVVHIPVLDQAYSLFPKLLPRKGSDGTGECQMSFVMTKGVATIDPFKARSEAVTVTAKGTVDLVRKQVDGTARANLRGVVGVITSPLSHVLMDMEINGPLDDVRISPQGPVAAAKDAVRAAKGGARFSSKVIGTGLSLPFRALGMLDAE